MKKKRRSFKRPPDEAVTKEVTVGPWPKLSVDKKKCVTSSTNSKQFNFFESNDSSKPTPAASKYSDPGVAFAYIETWSFSIQSRSGLPSGLQTRAKSGLPSGLQTQARSGPSSELQTREQSGPSNGLASLLPDSLLDSLLASPPYLPV